MKTLIFILTASVLTGCTTTTHITATNVTLRDVGPVTIRTNATLMPTP